MESDSGQSRELPMKQYFLMLPVTMSITPEDTIDEMREVIGRGGSISYASINPRAYWVAKHNPRYISILDRFDYVTCDGIGLVIAGRILGLDLRRISFDSTSLAPGVFSLCSELSLGVFLIGGVEGVASRARGTIQRQFPRLKIVGVHSGYFDDATRVAELIKRSRADVVVCGMGVPRQEEFLLELRERGWTGAGFGCGGYLDQLRTHFHYYPRLVDRLHLRFAYRLSRDPRRTLRRLVFEYPTFVLLLVQALIRSLLTFRAGKSG